MRRFTGFLLILVFLCTDFSVAQQTDKTSQYSQLQNVLTKLKAELENVPFNIQTIATQKFSYDSVRIRDQGYKLIKHEIERVFREHGRIKVLTLQEFEAQKVLYISGTDSTLSLRNTSRSASEKENSIRLLELSQKYGIDAFMKGHIQYDYSLGYVVTLELISPTSREVLWSKSLVSKSLQPEEEPYKGKLTLIEAGASLIPTTGYQLQGAPYSGEILLFDYGFRLALRQPINNENSGYIGLQAGYHYYSVMPKGSEESDYQGFNSSVYEFGAKFYKTLAEKTEQENEYWLSLYLGPNLLIPANSPNLFGLSQGVNVNMSDNLGVALDLQYLLTSTPSIENENETKNLQLNTIGYGIKILLRL